jgi:hypothetical protein
MIKHIAAFAAIVVLTLIRCSDTLEETMFNRDMETGKYNSSRWDRAKFD